jgi:hypothetical protein
MFKRNISPFQANVKRKLNKFTKQFEKKSATVRQVKQDVDREEELLI